MTADDFTWDTITEPAPRTPAEEAHAKLSALRHGDRFRLGNTGFEVRSLGTGPVYAIKQGTKGRKLYFMAVIDRHGCCGAFIHYGTTTAAAPDHEGLLTVEGNDHD